MSSDSCDFHYDTDDSTLFQGKGWIMLNIKKAAYVGLSCLFILSICFYYIVGDSIYYTNKNTEMVSVKNATPMLVKGTVVTQKLKIPFDTVEYVTVMPITYNRVNDSHLIMTLINPAGAVLMNETVSTKGMANGVPYEIKLPMPIRQVDNNELTLKIESVDGTDNNSVSLGYGNVRSIARVDIPIMIDSTEQICVDGQFLDGSLCFKIGGVDYHFLGNYYWYIVALALAGMGVFFFVEIKNIKQGKITIITRIVDLFSRYNFLIEQMVKRDFKAKYKRSILGVFWSFLNPLLTMAVQYAIFSTLFESNIKNFPIYLLIGIICFNFSNEAINRCIVAIVGNSHLITKVYIPKYIFPLTSVLSSTVNLLLSLLPLTIFVFLTGTQITAATLLLPFPLVSLFIFSLGIGLILCTGMVFFRDIQFLWGVVSMLWLYLTPIFYPEDIIPQEYLTIYHLNPLYPIISFLRSIIIDGVAPEPSLYLGCILAAFFPLTLGIWLFKKNQDKFIFNL